MILSDSEQRTQAIDPHQSFIVQAPAGSGKTEILSQRYLRLLSTVTAPEQIIALTFTRKAANEMRERILLALQRAAQQRLAPSEHQQKTHAFAQAALGRDQIYNWRLLEQPHRLKIITIDALCQTLTHAIPLQEQQIHAAQICDAPLKHYLAAATACLNFAMANEGYQQPLACLLFHLDNRQDIVLDLFVALLAKREQWLEMLFQAREQKRSTYEKGIAWIIQHELSRFTQTLPLGLGDELISLARQVATIENNPDSPRYQLREWVSMTELDGPLASGLASLLLTSQNTLRKAFDHHVGLKRGCCDNKDYTALKEASKQLLTQLDETPDCLAALLRIKNLPNPTYHSEQWELLQALFKLLPLLVAHLQQVFSEHNEVDFTAISQQAQRAMGDESSPTDLALYLDNQIHHLLVDEFQDTSLQQFELLSQLVCGWQPNDGKTLFVVGDPMQSIYRFRGAEVGLFLRTKQLGVGPVQLTPLELTCNFRSTPTIIRWINATFRHVFPPSNDIESGAVSFHPSQHVRDEHQQSQVLALQCLNKDHEAQVIIRRVKEELHANADDEIAILVRSRSQLTSIIQALRKERIPFQGVDIDLLAALPHLRDVWSLTQTLLMPANRLAWLSLLRSPWCGLSLPDLLRIGTFSKKTLIYEALSQSALLDQLSEEGQKRVQFVHAVMQHALTHRHQQSLVDWIIETLTQLHGKNILTQAEQGDLEQFWMLLKQFESNGLIENMALFKKSFKRLYSKKTTPSRLQIMTIHKSKGLEFDCVILPGLSAASSAKDLPLLRWLKLPTPDQNDLLLLSPIKAAHDEHCALYNYLGRLDEQKNHYELQRLFYVAATRAKKRLYLLDNTHTVRKGAFRHLIAEKFQEAEAYDANTLDVNPLPELYHLPVSFYAHPFAAPMLNQNRGLMMMDTTPRLTGIVAHELLQWICEHHPATLDDIPWDLSNHHFKTLGLTGSQLELAQKTLKQQITQFLNHPQGQWITQKHAQEHNEYEVLVEHDHEITTRIIDRTFIDNNIRWIIDFKTGQENTQTQSHHQIQLNAYAALLAAESSTPIRCGIYYLVNHHWLEWQPI